MSRLLYWAKLAGINVLIFVALILTVEVVVRLALPEIKPTDCDFSLLQDRRFGKAYGFKPNARGYSFDALVVTDHRGFRIDPSQPPRSEEKTILVIGDSLSQGVGVSAAESFPERLNRCFKTFQVINASVLGYDIPEYPEVLAKVLPEVRPEGIVVGICLNDLQIAGKDKFMAALRRGEITMEEYRLHYANPLYRVIRYLNDRYVDFNKYGNRYLRSYVAAKYLFMDTSKIRFFTDAAIYSKPETYHRACEGFRQLGHLAKQHNAWLEIIIFPYEYQLRSDGQELRQPQEVLLKAARAAGVSALDLTSPLRQHLVSQGLSFRRLFLYGDGMHFSPEGHAIIAKLIYKELTSRHLAY